VVARREDAAAALPEARDALTVRGGQPVARVHREEPKLVEVRRVETAQDLIVARGVGLAVARRDFAERAPLAVAQPRQVFAQEGEAADVPVVLRGRDGGLQKDADGSSHRLTRCRNVRRVPWALSGPAGDGIRIREFPQSRRGSGVKLCVCE
jgi:hypothetical protein